MQRSTDGLVGRQFGWRRSLGFLLACVLLAIMASAGVLQTLVQELVVSVQPALERHPLSGALALIGIAAIGAMAAFVSVAVLVPLATLVWGEMGTMLLLLWIGWILGGVLAYALAWHLGRRVVAWCGARRFLEQCETWVDPRTPFILILTLQLALPSEIPGYLLGLVRYPVRKYVAALALAELPYAVATVYLGSSFLQQRSVAILGIGATVAALSLFAAYRLRRELHADLRRASSPVRRSGSLGEEREVHFYQLGNRAGTHFLHQIGAVDLHGTFTQTQVDGDHLVCLACDDEAEYLFFARRQRFASRAHIRVTLDGGTILGILCQGPVGFRMRRYRCQP